jgi:hypothetical protein
VCVNFNNLEDDYTHITSQKERFRDSNFRDELNTEFMSVKIK